MVRAIILARTSRSKDDRSEVDGLASEIETWDHVKEATLTRSDPIELPTNNLGENIYGKPIERDLSVLVEAPSITEVNDIAGRMGQMKSVICPNIILRG